MSKPELIHRGKVRDVYLDGEILLLIATDRISAFDVILPSLIPEKGIALTQLSRFWFESLPEGINSHLIDFENPYPNEHPDWTGRITRCRKLEPVKMECVVRGYLAGSGWVDYQKTQTIQGHALPEGLIESSPLPEPLFTPTTKADVGHDMPLTREAGIDLLGHELYSALEEQSIALYQWAQKKAQASGIIIADTKLEFGYDGDEICLMDEIFTSDSSRFWPAEAFEPGRTQHSFDKQFVRDYLLSLKDWDRQEPGPELPEEIITQTRSRYFEVYELITGRSIDLKP
ncbi:MAG: phosphoribosylaminoimidazolesuccinocarboxamide synthase [Verrucomicrobiota bacterium]